MPLSDIVTVNVTTSSAQVERAGFGVPLILAADAPGGFTERVRSYTSITAVAVDFATTTATYKMAAAVFAQNPKLPKLKVGRLANKPTQRWAITPTAVNSYTYSLKVNGTTVSYTSDGSATATEIIAGLKTAIDALSLGITVSDQTTYMRIVANSAGALFGVELASLNLKLAQDHADPGYATDLDAILAEDHDWYAILNPFNSKAVVQAIAAWTETAKKLFIAQTQDSDVVDLSSGSDTGGSQTVAGALKASAYFRTSLIYHTDTRAFADGAWAGKVLSTDPGSETWAFKTLAGVAVVTLTDTQSANAFAKYVNTYTLVAGVHLTMKGLVSANEYIDVIRGRDWLESSLAADILAALANAKKVPFTDPGIATIEGIIRARLKAAVDVGFLSSSPAPKVVVPLAANVSSSDKAARTLTGVTFDGVLAGAIQATTINGTVSV